MTMSMMMMRRSLRTVPSCKPVLLKTLNGLTNVQRTRLFTTFGSPLFNQKNNDQVELQYYNKLLEKAKKEGFESIEELKKHLAEEIQEKKKKFNKIDPLKELEAYEERMSAEANRSGNTTVFGKDPVKTKGGDKNSPFQTLDSYLKLDKLENLSKQEVEFLWRAKFSANENALHAVVPVSTFEPMFKNAKKNPNFVLPLPRDLNADIDATSKKEGTAEKPAQPGMELHYVQWSFVGEHTVHCMVTSLAEFKLHKEYARPHITMSFHSELAKDKKMVLMNGLVEPNCNISMQDAQLLLLNIQRFYGCMGESSPTAIKRIQLLRDFTNGSPDFNVDSLIELAQSLEN